MSAFTTHRASRRRVCARPGRTGVWRASRSGMTLMEVMVVVALIAALTALTAFGLGFIGRADVQGEALRVSGVIRYVYNQAATQNRTLQLVVDLDAGTLSVDELDVAGGAMTREELAGSTMAAQSAEDAEGFGERGLSTRIDDEDEQFVAIQRSPVSGPLLDEEDRVIKEGVHVVGVMTSHHEKLQTDGVATINFFPSGFVERSVIYIGDEEARASEDEGVVFTLMINSLTGQTTIRPGRVPVEDRFFEAREDD